MAAKGKKTEPVPLTSREIWQKIVDGTNSKGFVYMSDVFYGPFQAKGYVEVNPEMINPDNPNEFAVRATQVGLDAVAAAENADNNKGTEKLTDTNQNAAPAASNSKFEIITGAVAPARKRGGRSGSTYPFDKLEVGGSFFVPATEKTPAPHKNLTSTVSSANNRYANDTGEKRIVTRKGKDGNVSSREVPKLQLTRVFSVARVEKGKTYGSWQAPADGALVSRKADAS